MLFLMAASAGLHASPYPETILQWTAEDKAAQREAGKQLVEQIKAAKGNFTIPPGDYRFAQSCLLNNLSDLVIDAGGATFWFENHKIVGLKFSGCRNVTLRGLSIDYDPLPYTQSVITAINPEAMTIDVEIDSGYPVPDEDWIADAAKFGTHKAIFFDAEGEHMLDVKFDWIGQLEALGDRAFRIKFHADQPFKNATSPDAFQIGDRYVLPNRRHLPALELHNSERMTMEGVTVFTSPAMGIVETYGVGGNVYRDCRIVRRPGTTRLFSAVADAFHSMMMVHGPTVAGCEFAYNGDDAVAIHGFFSVVLDQPSPHVVILANVFQGDTQVGSHLEFYDVNRGTPQGRAVVRKITPVHDEALKQAARNLPKAIHNSKSVNIRGLVRAELYRVELGAPLTLPKYAIAASNERTGAGAIIRDNDLHDCRVRGIFLRTQDALIEGNRISHTGMAGISLTPDRFFLEGSFAHRVKIRDNTLTSTGITTFNQHYVHREQFGAITVSADFGPRFTPASMHAYIDITGNTIISPSGPAILMSNVANGLIADNVIIEPYAKLSTLEAADSNYRLPRFDVEPTAWRQMPLGAIAIMYCSDVIIRGNMVEEAPAALTAQVEYGPGMKPGSIPKE